MLNYNELKPRKYIVLDGAPYEVLSSHVFRKQQRKPVNQTKLKHLITGKVTEQSFHQSDKIEEADVTTQKIIYIYTNKDEVWFHEAGNPGNRFTISLETIEEQVKFLKEKTEVEGLVFDETIVGITLPIKMTFEVTEAPPNVKGNTSGGGDKKVTIETGATITTPLFIETGDTIEVNTETGEYVQRVS